MAELILHRGGQLINRDELDLIPIPEATESYIPVSHYDLSKTLVTIGQDILTDYTLVGENYAIARNGNQMFAVLKFQNKNSDMALSVGFRNSYDRSMSVGFAVGASVFVCDNLALYGDVTVMRKHTKNVWSALEDMAITTIYKSQLSYEKIIEDAEALKNIKVSDDSSFKMLGLLFGHGIVSPRQLPVVKAEWLNPTHTEFQPRNAWSFYNACTQALKSSPPISIMEKHIDLHKTIVEGKEVWQ
jgi:hypothetical protein